MRCCGTGKRSQPREECAAEKIRGPEGGWRPLRVLPECGRCKANKARRTGTIIIFLLFLNEIVGAQTKQQHARIHSTDFLKRARGPPVKRKIPREQNRTELGNIKAHKEKRIHYRHTRRLLVFRKNNNRKILLSVQNCSFEFLEKKAFFYLLNRSRSAYNCFCVLGRSSFCSSLNTDTDKKKKRDVGDTT